MNKDNQHIGGSLNEFLEEEGLLDTSRSALDRLLDPDNDSVTLKTLQNAASTIGAHLEMKLVFNKEAA